MKHRYQANAKRSYSFPFAHNDNALILIILLLLLLVGIGLKQGLSIASESQITGQIKPKELTPTAEFPKITWEDFRGEPHYDLEFLSLSFWKVTYSYTIVFSGGKIKILMNAQCVMEKDKSWVKPEFKSPELLEHEQGHYYIGCLCALTFKKRVKEAEFSKTNYRAEIERLFEQTLTEFLRTEEKYDWETDHFINPEEQEKWNKELISQVNTLSEFWWF